MCGWANHFWIFDPDTTPRIQPQIDCFYYEFFIFSTRILIFHLIYPPKMSKITKLPQNTPTYLKIPQNIVKYLKYPNFDRQYPQDHFWTPTPLRPFFEPTILNIKFKFSEAAIIKLGIAPKNTIGQQIKASTLKIEANLVSQQELLSGRLNKFYSQYWGNQGILGVLEIWVFWGILRIWVFWGIWRNLGILGGKCHPHTHTYHMAKTRSL